MGLTPTLFQLCFSRAGGLPIALSHPPYSQGPVISPASARLTAVSNSTPSQTSRPPWLAHSALRVFRTWLVLTVYRCLQLLPWRPLTPFLRARASQTSSSIHQTLWGEFGPLVEVWPAALRDLDESSCSLRAVQLAVVPSSSPLILPLRLRALQLPCDVREVVARLQHVLFF